MDSGAQILPGTLDLLILKAVSLGPLHGYGVLLRIEQISKGALVIEQGALYPALFRLVRQGLLKATWGKWRIRTKRPGGETSWGQIGARVLASRGKRNRPAFRGARRRAILCW